MEALALAERHDLPGWRPTPPPRWAASRRPAPRRSWRAALVDAARRARETGAVHAELRALYLLGRSYQDWAD